MRVPFALRALKVNAALLAHAQNMRTRFVVMVPQALEATEDGKLIAIKRQGAMHN